MMTDPAAQLRLAAAAAGRPSRRRWSRLKQPAAIAAAAIILASSAGPTASADAPPWQHPRPDPTAGCTLQPDPIGGSEQVYPAGDDEYTVYIGAGPTVLDVLANDCINSSPGTHRVIDHDGAVPADQLGQGIGRQPVIGDLAADGTQITFTPSGEWSGDAKFHYIWVEDGTETDSAFSGAYDHRWSSTAVVTIHVVPVPPTPTAIASSPTATPTNTRPTAASSSAPLAWPSSSPAPISSAIAAAVAHLTPTRPANSLEPQSTTRAVLANTGSPIVRPLGVVAVLLALGVVLLLVAARRPRGRHTAARRGNRSQTITPDLPTSSAGN